MSVASLLPSIAEDYQPRRKFTRSEVYQLLESGFFDGQRFELIHGDVISKLGQSARHAYSLQRSAGLLIREFGADAVRIQVPMTVHPSESDYNEPEPDVAVLAVPSDIYRSRHPRGDEMLLVAEIADSSVRQDLTIKRDLYARAGVPENWVLDVSSSRLIVHRRPAGGNYEETIYLDGGTVPVPSRPGAAIHMADLFT
jgi:Uma2 family endonuclease